MKVEISMKDKKLRVLSITPESEVIQILSNETLLNMLKKFSNERLSLVNTTSVGKWLLETGRAEKGKERQKAIYYMKKLCEAGLAEELERGRGRGVQREWKLENVDFSAILLNLKEQTIEGLNLDLAKKLIRAIVLGVNWLKNNMRGDGWALFGKLPDTSTTAICLSALLKSGDFNPSLIRKVVDFIYSKAVHQKGRVFWYIPAISDDYNKTNIEGTTIVLETLSLTPYLKNEFNCGFHFFLNSLKVVGKGAGWGPGTAEEPNPLSTAGTLISLLEIKERLGNERFFNLVSEGRFQEICNKCKVFLKERFQGFWQVKYPTYPSYTISTTAVVCLALDKLLDKELKKERKRAWNFLLNSMRKTPTGEIYWDDSSFPMITDFWGRQLKDDIRPTLVILLNALNPKLKNRKEILDSGIEYLLNRQSPDGGWSIGDIPSTSLYTAMVVEVLSEIFFRVFGTKPL